MINFVAAMNYFYLISILMFLTPNYVEPGMLQSIRDKVGSLLWENGSCNCGFTRCGCCLRVTADYLELNQKGCLNANVDPLTLSMEVSGTLNNQTIFTTTIPLNKLTGPHPQLRSLYPVREPNMEDGSEILTELYNDEGSPELQNSQLRSILLDKLQPQQQSNSEEVKRKRSPDDIQNPQLRFSFLDMFKSKESNIGVTRGVTKELFAPIKFCLSLPLLPPVITPCAQIRDIGLKNGTFNACFDVQVKALGMVVKTIELGCLGIPIPFQ